MFGFGVAKEGFWGELPESAWRRRHSRDASTCPRSRRSFGLAQHDTVGGQLLCEDESVLLRSSGKVLVTAAAEAERFEAKPQA
jgi:hypothetical protein